MQMSSKYIRNRYNNKTNWSHILYQLTGCVPIHRYPIHGASDQKLKKYSQLSLLAPESLIFGVKQGQANWQPISVFPHFFTSTVRE